MKLYKVKVRCFYIETAQSDKPKACWMTALVNAVTCDEAMNFAACFVESHAEIGPKWLAFEARECCEVQLPCLTATL